jgi:simple sugar transport system ATP-binding protein
VSSDDSGETNVVSLELADVSKNFGPIKALINVSMALESGQVVGLMGDNGAGKSTLVKVIAGNFQPSHGLIKIDGRAIEFRDPSEARQSGIEVVYQDLALCDNLTAAANVFLGRELRIGFGPLHVLNYGAMFRHADTLFKEIKSDVRSKDLVRHMSGGQRQAVAIARTLVGAARFLLLDEPTAATSVRQTTEVLNLIRRLRDEGLAVLLVSHRTPDVFSVSDRIIVLRRGQKVADKMIAWTTAEEVTGLITGTIEQA